jgi:hypothetical protein
MQMKCFCRLALLSISVLFLSGCQKLNSEDITTQPRDYIDDTIEQTEDMDNTITAASNIDENMSYLSAEAIQKKYPNIDFNQKVLSLNDEIVYHLSLNTRFVEDCAICYKEGGYYDYCPFYMKINSAEEIAGMQNLNEYFQKCEALNDTDYINYFGEDTIKNGEYLMMNITIQNKSKDNQIINMANKDLEVVYDEIGIYRIVEPVGMFIDMDYEGNGRGTGKSKNEISFASGEEITMNMVYLLAEEIDKDSLYYNVNNLWRDGSLYDDGTWHADSEGGPNLIKVVVNDK